jgi:hypothetical protein
MTINDLDLYNFLIMWYLLQPNIINLKISNLDDKISVLSQLYAEAQGW